MASETDRRKARQQEMERSVHQDFGLFDGLETMEPDQPTDLERVVKISKSPLYLALMAMSKDFPLFYQESTLLVNPDNEKGYDVGTAVLKPYANIVCHDGEILTSLAAMAKKYQPYTRKKSKWPDGWETVKTEAGSGFISLNRLFTLYYHLLEVPLDILENELSLMEWMLVNGYIRKREDAISLLSDVSRKAMTKDMK